MKQNRIMDCVSIKGTVSNPPYLVNKKLNAKQLNLFIDQNIHKEASHHYTSVQLLPEFQHRIWLQMKSGFTHGRIFKNAEHLDWEWKPHFSWKHANVEGLPKSTLQKIENVSVTHDTVDINETGCLVYTVTVNDPQLIQTLPEDQIYHGSGKYDYQLYLSQPDDVQKPFITGKTTFEYVFSEKGFLRINVDKSDANNIGVFSDRMIRQDICQCNIINHE